MATAMKVLSILGVLLRWACGRGDGGEETNLSAPAEPSFSVIRHSHASMGRITTRT